MRELVVQIPDVEAFLALAPEELAAKMLFLLRQRRQDMIHGSSWSATIRNSVTTIRIAG